MGVVQDPISPEDLAILRQRVECVRYWLNSFAPDEVKFAVCENMPSCELSEDEKCFLRELMVSMEGVEWKGKAIHDAMYACAKGSNIGARGGFQTLYKIFCDQTRGHGWASSSPLSTVSSFWVGSRKPPSGSSPLMGDHRSPFPGGPRCPSSIMF
jgi:lysyl-tRNA synthetase class I